MSDGKGPKPNIKRIDEFHWEVAINKEYGMRVPGLIIADDELMRAAVEDGSVMQVMNTATVPGITGYALALPDIHYGYGLPIGGVMASDFEHGVVSPGGVGFDINCGVRLVRSNLDASKLHKSIPEVINALASQVPHGVGSHGKIIVKGKGLDDVLIKGARWAVEQGFGFEEDLEYTEEHGCFMGADPSYISKEARERGRDQQGTLGSGNHFLEVQTVDAIYDSEAAAAFGLFENQITLMIHSGSRGFGHQVCTDSLEIMGRSLRKYNISLPDKQLACAPLSSPEGKAYLASMKCAANYAWANRQCMMHWARQAIAKALDRKPSDLGLELVYDVAHNIVKIEEHLFQGQLKTLAVHRKGATRAFGPNRVEVSERYRKIGQPVLVPGDMGRASYVLAGTAKAMSETFGSTCHGAGRVLSRAAAIRKAKGRSIEKELETYGIFARAASKKTLVEEMPEAYKDVSHVVDIVTGAGISKKVAKLRPLGVVKG